MHFEFQSYHNKLVPNIDFNSKNFHFVHFQVLKTITIIYKPNKASNSTDYTSRLSK